MKKSPLSIEKYFAAANGYLGFKSYFSSVFNPREYDRIYILKGGPGTGKSTFMKKLSKLFSEQNYRVENIHCSSDTRSLDGVIAQRGKNRVAIIDGTAPHERDAILPGAFDEIINFSDAFDTKWLIGEKDKISKLNSDKAAAYKTAYSYLSFSGKYHDMLKSYYKEAKSREIYNISTKITAELIVGAKIGNSGVRLVSAFGKDGCVRFDTVEKLSGSLYSLPDSVPSQMIIKSISQSLQERGIEFISFPSCADATLSDAIYIPSTGLGVIIGELGTPIDTASINEMSELVSESLRTAKEIYDTALSEAQRWFSIASDMHFRLEEIYSEAVNFEIIDDIYEKKSAEILKILS